MTSTVPGVATLQSHSAAPATASLPLAASSSIAAEASSCCRLSVATNTDVSYLNRLKLPGGYSLVNTCHVKRSVALPPIASNEQSTKSSPSRDSCQHLPSKIVNSNNSSCIVVNDSRIKDTLSCEHISVQPECSLDRRKVYYATPVEREDVFSSSWQPCRAQPPTPPHPSSSTAATAEPSCDAAGSIVPKFHSSKTSNNLAMFAFDDEDKNEENSLTIPKYAFTDGCSKHTQISTDNGSILNIMKNDSRSVANNSETAASGHSQSVYPHISCLDNTPAPPPASQQYSNTPGTVGGQDSSLYPSLRDMDDHRAVFGPPQLQPDVIASKVRTLCRVTPPREHTTNSDAPREDSLRRQSRVAEESSAGTLNLVLPPVSPHEHSLGASPGMYPDSGTSITPQNEQRAVQLLSQDAASQSTSVRATECSVLEGVTDVIYGNKVHNKLQWRTLDPERVVPCQEANVHESLQRTISKTSALELIDVKGSVIQSDNDNSDITSAVAEEGKKVIFIVGEDDELDEIKERARPAPPGGQDSGHLISCAPPPVDTRQLRQTLLVSRAVNSRVRQSDISTNTFIRCRSETTFSSASTGHKRTSSDPPTKEQLHDHAPEAPQHHHPIQHCQAVAPPHLVEKAVQTEDDIEEDTIRNVEFVPIPA